MGTFALDTVINNNTIKENLYSKFQIYEYIDGHKFFSFYF